MIKIIGTSFVLGLFLAGSPARVIADEGASLGDSAVGASLPLDSHAQVSADSANGRHHGGHHHGGYSHGSYGHGGYGHGGYGHGGYGHGGHYYGSYGGGYSNYGYNRGYYGHHGYRPNDYSYGGYYRPSYFYGDYYRSYDYYPVYSYPVYSYPVYSYPVYRYPLRCAVEENLAPLTVVKSAVEPRLPAFTNDNATFVYDGNPIKKTAPDMVKQATVKRAPAPAAVPATASNGIAYPAYGESAVLPANKTLVSRAR